MAPLVPFQTGLSRLLPRNETFEAVPEAVRLVYVFLSVATTMVTINSFIFKLRSIIIESREQPVKPLHVITLFIYFLGSMFALSAATIMFGLGFTDWIQCHAAVILCCIFYFGEKLSLYLFLVERTHVVRSRTLPRYKNKIYMIALGVVFTGFGILAITCFLWMIYDYDTDSGACYIGLPTRVSIPLLTFDICINLSLTGLFVYFMKPYMTGNFLDFVFGRDLFMNASPSAKREMGAGAGDINIPQKMLKKIIRKTLIGSILIMPSTITNLTFMAATQGHEDAWECLTICSIDILWCTLVIQWITQIPEEATHNKQAYSYPNKPSQGSSNFKGHHKSSKLSESSTTTTTTNSTSVVYASYVAPKVPHTSQTELVGADAAAAAAEDGDFVIRREVEISQNFSSSAPPHAISTNSDSPHGDHDPKNSATFSFAEF